VDRRLENAEILYSECVGTGLKGQEWLECAQDALRLYLEAFAHSLPEEFESVSNCFVLAERLRVFASTDTGDEEKANWQNSLRRLANDLERRRSSRDCKGSDSVERTLTLAHAFRVCGWMERAQQQYQRVREELEAASERRALSSKEQRNLQVAYEGVAHARTPETDPAARKRRTKELYHNAQAGPFQAFGAAEIALHAKFRGDLERYELFRQRAFVELQGRPSELAHQQLVEAILEGDFSSCRALLNAQPHSPQTASMIKSIDVSERGYAVVEAMNEFSAFTKSEAPDAQEGEALKHKWRSAIRSMEEMLDTAEERTARMRLLENICAVYRDWIYQASYWIDQAGALPLMSRARDLVLFDFYLSQLRKDQPEARNDLDYTGRLLDHARVLAFRADEMDEPWQIEHVQWTLDLVWELASDGLQRGSDDWLQLRTEADGLAEWIASSPEEIGGTGSAWRTGVPGTRKVVLQWADGEALFFGRRIGVFGGAIEPKHVEVLRILAQRANRTCRQAEINDALNRPKPTELRSSVSKLRRALRSHLQRLDAGERQILISHLKTAGVTLHNVDVRRRERSTRWDESTTKQVVNQLIQTRRGEGYRLQLPSEAISLEP